MLRMRWPDWLRVSLARSSQASARLSRRALSPGEAARRASSTDRMAFNRYSYSFLVTDHLCRQTSPCPPLSKTRLRAMRSWNLERFRTGPKKILQPPCIGKKKAPHGYSSWKQISSDLSECWDVGHGTSTAELR